MPAQFRWQRRYRTRGWRSRHERLWLRPFRCHTLVQSAYRIRRIARCSQLYFDWLSPALRWDRQSHRSAPFVGRGQWSAEPNSLWKTRWSLPASLELQERSTEAAAQVSYWRSLLVVLLPPSA